MARRMTRAERKADTRERLVAAARRVFGRRGYHAASVDEVAREAGFTTGAVYSNFDGKEGLFLAVYEEMVGERRREVAAAAELGEPSGEAAREVADQWMRRVSSDPESFMVLIEFWAWGVRDEDLRPEFAARFGAMRIVIGRLLERVMAERGVTLPLPAEQLGTALKALANGLALEKLADPDGVPDELLGHTIELLLDGIAARAGVAAA